ncbi:MAG: spore maturation protein [Clostridiales bacterium]|nr:spore maturation protein [Clostridiales bacterium]
MNTVFFLCVFISMLCLLFTSPLEILPAISVGTQGAVSLCLSLTASFALWGGFTEIAKHTGAQRGLANLLRKPLSFLFGKTEKGATEDIATNLSANFLGLGAIATPAGISAVKELKRGAETVQTFERQTGILLILNSCCLQLLPTSVISLRLALGSSAPTDIWLPTLLTGTFSTLLALSVAVFWQKIARKRERKIIVPRPIFRKRPKEGTARV